MESHGQPGCLSSTVQGHRQHPDVSTSLPFSSTQNSCLCCLYLNLSTPELPQKSRDELMGSARGRSEPGTLTHRGRDLKPTPAAQLPITAHCCRIHTSSHSLSSFLEQVLSALQGAQSFVLSSHQQPGPTPALPKIFGTGYRRNSV